MPDGVEARITEAIRERLFPGCVVGVIQADGASAIRAYGEIRYDDEPVREDTVYDLASVTKSIPLAALAAIFIDEKKFALADKATGYLPELQNDFGATIEDLLRYRVRGAALSKLPFTTFEEVRAHVFEHGFDGPPGERAYTNLPAYLLGIVCERVGGASLEVLAHRYLFAPLRMERTTYFPAASDCAPTEVGARGEVRGLPHDESAYLFARERRSVGHAGLFSTAGDLLVFARALLDDSLPVVQNAALEGLGWDVGNARFMGQHAHERMVGKTGFTGTSIVCDLERGIAVVVLSNRTYPERPANDESLWRFRAAVSDLIFRPIH